MDHIDQNQERRPGVINYPKPIEINGQFYDPVHPPLQIKNDDGIIEYKGGNKITKDQAYSMLFWSKGQPEGLLNSMKQNINSAALKGEFSAFVGTTTAQEGTSLNEESKEKLSAYRVLAEEMGYEIGGFKLNEDSGTVSASISQQISSNQE